MKEERLLFLLLAVVMEVPHFNFIFWGYNFLCSSNFFSFVVFRIFFFRNSSKIVASLFFGHIYMKLGMYCAYVVSMCDTYRRNILI